MKDKKVISKNYLDIVFVPSSELKYHKGDDGFTVLDIEHKGFFNKIAQKLFKKPRFSHIKTDVYGTALWECLDGKNTVNDVINTMKDTFPDEKEKMLDRCIHFLYVLERNKFIRRIDR